MPDTPEYRLPRSVEPERYQLEITPELEPCTFKGRERIAIRVHQPVRQIMLNAAELEVSAATVRPGDGTGAARPASVSFDEEEERLLLDLEDELAPGGWLLDIEFSGSINDKLRGFYR